MRVTLMAMLGMLLNLYVPYGRGPRGPTLGSAYGTTGLSGFLQLRIYN